MKKKDEVVVTYTPQETADIDEVMMECDNLDAQAIYDRHNGDRDKINEEMQTSKLYIMVKQKEQTFLKGIRGRKDFHTSILNMYKRLMIVYRDMDKLPKKD